MSLLSDEETKEIVGKSWCAFPMKVFHNIAQAQHAKDQTELEELKKQLDGIHAIGFRDGVIEDRKEQERKVREIFEGIENGEATIGCRCGCWEKFKSKYLKDRKEGEDVVSNV